MNNFLTASEPHAEFALLNATSEVLVGGGVTGWATGIVVGGEWWGGSVGGWGIGVEVRLVSGGVQMITRGRATLPICNFSITSGPNSNHLVHLWQQNSQSSVFKAIFGIGQALFWLQSHTWATSKQFSDFKAIFGIGQANNCCQRWPKWLLSKCVYLASPNVRLIKQNKAYTLGN